MFCCSIKKGWVFVFYKSFTMRLYAHEIPMWSPPLYRKNSTTFSVHCGVCSQKYSHVVGESVDEICWKRKCTKLIIQLNVGGRLANRFYIKLDTTKKTPKLHGTTKFTNLICSNYTNFQTYATLTFVLFRSTNSSPARYFIIPSDAYHK